MVKKAKGTMQGRTISNKKLYIFQITLLASFYWYGIYSQPLKVEPDSNYP